MALEGLSRGIFRSLGFLKNRRKLDEEELRDMTRSLRRALQEADFNVRQTKEIVERMETRLREEELRPGLTLQTHAMNILYTELVRILGQPINFNQEVQHFFWSVYTVKEKQQLQPNLLNGIVKSMV